ncbi:MAG: flagellar hook-associated protein FlgK [Moraxellaceae bacterium]|nr:flagellar hook-associated protein FlgK [Moraxellaceae bacterium]MDZ4296746.1 flagellar hook-associated protein FlgK [Moraxellaceae bacterium]MDZ4387057.1 flagellar hook-associated protein FlgK [Moraxellaceae bacterium]
MSSILNTALSALNANQRALATVSNNIANVNTDGYSRQTVDMATRQPNQFGFGAIGTGVQITGIRRSYDEFVTTQLRNNTAGFFDQNTRYELGSQLERVLVDEGNGINSAFSRFFNSLQDVAASPSSLSARQVMLSQAQALANRFVDANAQFTEVGNEVDARINVAINDMNALVQRIGDLNEVISKSAGQRQGAQPNDLLDQRDSAILALSKLVKVTTTQASDGSMSVFTGSGQPLVLSGQINTLSLDNNGRILLGGVSDITASLSGGAVGGLLAFRDGTLATAKQELTEIAKTIADQFNALQVGGVDLAGANGTPLFGYNGDADNSSEFILSVRINDPVKIAASQGGGIGDNSNILAMAALERSAVSINGKTTTLGDSLRGLVGTVANQVREARLGSEAQNSLMQQSLLRRDGISGVNLDEEAADLMKYQQAYQAAAQMSAVANSIFQTLMDAFRR